jgi:hypothetical protein
VARSAATPRPGARITRKTELERLYREYLPFVLAFCLKRLGNQSEAEDCACRKCHPRWSGCMVVLVEDAAQPWASADVELTDLGLRGDRHRQGL